MHSQPTGSPDPRTYTCPAPSAPVSVVPSSPAHPHIPMSSPHSHPTEHRNPRRSGCAHVPHPLPRHTVLKQVPPSPVPAYEPHASAAITLLALLTTDGATAHVACHRRPMASSGWSTPTCLPSWRPGPPVIQCLTTNDLLDLLTPESELVNVVRAENLAFVPFPLPPSASALADYYCIDGPPLPRVLQFAAYWLTETAPPGPRR